MNIIARIENHIDRHEELAVSLQQDDSEYQLVDSKFRRINRKRWISLSSSQSASRSISIRLIKIPTTGRRGKLSVAYAEDIFLAERGYAWDIVTLKAEEVRLQDELKAGHRRRRSLGNLLQVEGRLKSVRKQLDHATYIRNLRRILLCLVRYHLIDPHGLLWAKDERWLRERTPPKPKSGHEQGQTGASDKEHEGGSALRQTSSAGSEKIKGQPRHSTTQSKHQAALVHSAIHQLQRQSLERRRAVNDVVSPPSQAQKGPLRALNASVDQAYTLPERSMTSRSLQLVKSPKLFPFKRSKTFTAKDLDIEAQNAPGTGAQHVTFATTAQASWRAPTNLTVKDAQGGHIQSPPMPRSSRPAPAQIFRRRLSSKEFRNAGPVTLSPRRLPLHVWQSRVPPYDGEESVRGDSTQFTGLRIITQSSNSALSVGVSNSAGGVTNPKSNENTIRARIRDVRNEKDMKSLRPFFLWKGPTAATPTTPRESDAGMTPRALQEEDDATLNGSVSPMPELESTKDLLDILNLGLETDQYVSENFPVQHEHYNAAKTTTIWEAADHLSRQLNKEVLIDGAQNEETTTLLVAKIDIVLRVDAIFRCFVDETHESEAIFAKAWGIVTKLNELGLEDVRPRSPELLSSGLLTAYTAQDRQSDLSEEPQ